MPGQRIAILFYFGEFFSSKIGTVSMNHADCGDMKLSVRFRGFPIHGFAYAKVKKSIFNRKIQELVGDLDIILNDFKS